MCLEYSKTLHQSETGPDGDFTDEGRSHRFGSGPKMRDTSKLDAHLSMNISTNAMAVNVRYVINKAGHSMFGVPGEVTTRQG